MTELILQEAIYHHKPEKRIIKAVIRGIKETKMVGQVYWMLTLSLLNAVGIFLTQYLSFELAEYAKLEDTDTVIYIVIGSGVLYCIMKIMLCYSYTTNERIGLKLADHLTRIYNDMIRNSDENWLRSRDTSSDQSAIKSGIRSCIMTGQNVNNIINSILLAVSSLLIMSIKVKLLALPTIAIMIVILSIGCYFLKNNYVEHKQIERFTNPISTFMTFLSKSIFSARLNGNDLLGQIGENSLKKIEMETEVDIAVEIRYGILETVHYALLYANILLIAYYLGKDNLITILPIINTLNRACGSMWRLFHTLHITARTASGWSTLEILVDDVIMKVETPKLPFESSVKIINKCLNIKLKECTKHIQICGPSGAGKSTLVEDLAIKIVKTYGYICEYMPQSVNVIKNEHLSMYQYLTMYIPKDLHKHKNTIIDIILKLANDLSISDTVVNLVALDSSIKDPSGGEEKRFAFIQMILKTLLSVKLNMPIKPILFLDEPTSGLDKNNHKRVEEILDMLIKKYGVCIIEISHNENISDDIVRLDVIKTDKVKKKVWSKIEDNGGLSYYIDMITGESEVNYDYEPTDIREKPDVNAIIQTHDKRLLDTMKNVIQNQELLKKILEKGQYDREQLDEYNELLEKSSRLQEELNL